MPAELATEPTSCPCASCETTGGRRKHLHGEPHGSPLRYSGERFGVVGMLCKTCWQRFDYREKAGLAKQGVKREPRDKAKFTPAEYVPTAEQIAEAAREERAKWGMAGVNMRNSRIGEMIEAKDEAARRRCAKRAEIERADARAGRQRVMRAGGVRFYA